MSRMYWSTSQSSDELTEELSIMFLNNVLPAKELRCEEERCDRRI